MAKIKVIATRIGYYEDMRRFPDDDPRHKGPFLVDEKDFSDSTKLIGANKGKRGSIGLYGWMKRVDNVEDGNEPVITEPEPTAEAPEPVEPEQIKRRPGRPKVVKQGE